MPYKSEAQRRYFNANRAELEAAGVDVDHWNEESRGKKLPKRKRKKVKNDNRKKAAMVLLSLKYEQKKAASRRSLVQDFRKLEQKKAAVNRSLIEDVRLLRERGRRQLYQKVAQDGDVPFTDQVGDYFQNIGRGLANLASDSARAVGADGGEAPSLWEKFKDSIRSGSAAAGEKGLEYYERLKEAINYPKLTEFVQEHPDLINALRYAGYGSLIGGGYGLASEFLKDDDEEKNYLGSALRSALLGGTAGGLGAYGLNKLYRYGQQAPPVGDAEALEIIDDIMSNAEGMSEGEIIRAIEDAIPDPADRSAALQEYLKKNPVENIIQKIYRENQSVADPAFVTGLGAAGGWTAQNLMSQRIKPDVRARIGSGSKWAIPWLQTHTHVGARKIDPKDLERVLKKHIAKKYHKDINAALENPKYYRRIANLKYDNTRGYFPRETGIPGFNPSLQARRKIDHDIRMLGRRAVGRKLPQNAAWWRRFLAKMPRGSGAAIGAGLAGLGYFSGNSSGLTNVTPDYIDIPDQSSYEPPPPATMPEPPTPQFR